MQDFPSLVLKQKQSTCSFTLVRKAFTPELVLSLQQVFSPFVACAPVLRQCQNSELNKRQIRQKSSSTHARTHTLCIPGQTLVTFLAKTPQPFFQGHATSAALGRCGENKAAGHMDTLAMHRRSCD